MHDLKEVGFRNAWDEVVVSAFLLNFGGGFM